MPPPAIRTVRDLLYWQYAKIISNSAGAGKRNYGFIMDRFKKLRSGDIQWSSSIREYVKEHEEPNKCVYCGAGGDLTLEHMLPKARRGPDVPENAVWVCASCNSKKGSKRLYEWYGLESRNALPRIAEGKYLKLLYSLHEEKGTLNAVPNDLCPSCDLWAQNVRLREACRSTASRALSRSPECQASPGSRRKRAGFNPRGRWNGYVPSCDGIRLVP